MKQNNMISSFIDLYNKINSNKSLISEIVCFILFVVGVIFLSFFHEPWFDELQAWNISRDNLYNILFVLPHYEGHPPLWHLLLKIFSSLHVHPEVGLGIVNTAFISAAVWLLLFKSPFPKIIRLVLPFTYFIFYQYGVICRPYSIFIFALFLIGTFYKDKNEKPFKFVSALGLLCLSSAFGMVVAFGVVLSWLFEIWNKQNIFSFVKSFLKDKRFFALLVLFFLCLALAFEIFPDPNAFATGKLTNFSVFERILYFSLIQPLDTTFTNFYDYNISAKPFATLKICCFCILGLLINIIIMIQFYKAKKLLFFTCVYLMFILCTFFVCLHVHHLGLLLMVFIFCFWCLFSTNKDVKLNVLLKIFVAITIFVQLSWTISSSINEVKNMYAPYRNLAIFINKYNLQDYKYASKIDGEKIINPNSQPGACGVNAYFTKNIFLYFNVFTPDKTYTISKILTTEEFNEYKKACKNTGKPDFIVGDLVLETILGDGVSLHKDYFPLKGFCGGTIFKDSQYPGCVYLYAHKRFFDKMKNYE